MEQGPLDLAVASYPAKWSSLETLSLAYIAAALVDLGCFTRAGERHTLAALAERWGLPAPRRHLLSRWLARLVAAGLLVADGDELVSPVPLSTGELGSARAAARTALADTPALMEYVERCGARLTAILSGAESPLETLFPEGSVETAEYLYQRVAGRALHERARRRRRRRLGPRPAGGPADPGHRGRSGHRRHDLRGAPACSRRSGPSTTTPTCRRSSSATRRAKFAAYPFVKTALLDLERAPAEQGWAPGGYHVVVAANVLHATRDLDRTLAHVRGLLAPGGMLVAYEATEHLPWFDVTTGLIEGWQRFDDQLARRSSAARAGALARGARRPWLHAHVAAFPESGSPAEVLAHHVIVAMVPGTTARVPGADRGVGRPSPARRSPPMKAPHRGSQSRNSAGTWPRSRRASSTRR